MKKSLVKARWAEGRAATCAILHLADGAYAEFAAAQDAFDCIWYDLEHGPITVEHAADLFRAVRLQGKDVMARPGKGEFMRMGRMLEQGANGIMYPRCETAEDAREFVRWAKFAPLGERGYAGDNAEAGYGTADVNAYVTAANEETFLAPMIESPTALANAQAITETEGDVLISITVPEELRAEGRSFVIVYTHEGGEAKTITPVSYDPETGILQFKANQFSTYALVYSDDLKVSEDSTVSPKTGDAGKVVGVFTVMMIAAGVAVLSRKRAKC